jgi:hypothetical protein
MRDSETSTGGGRGALALVGGGGGGGVEVVVVVVAVLVAVVVLPFGGRGDDSNTADTSSGFSLAASSDLTVGALRTRITWALSPRHGQTGGGAHGSDWQGGGGGHEQSLLVSRLLTI